MEDNKGKISFEDFAKIDLRVAKIIKAEKLEGSEKLVKLQIDLGGEIGESPSLRSEATAGTQILAGIAQFYNPEDLVGKQIVVVANLEPRKLMGEESNGMLLAAHGENGEPILLTPDKEAKIGSKVS